MHYGLNILSVYGKRAEELLRRIGVVASFYQEVRKETHTIVLLFNKKMSSVVKPRILRRRSSSTSLSDAQSPTTAHVKAYVRRVSSKQLLVFPEWDIKVMFN